MIGGDAGVVLVGQGEVWGLSRAIDSKRAVSLETGRKKEAGTGTVTGWGSSRGTEAG